MLKADSSSSGRAPKGSNGEGFHPTGRAGHVLGVWYTQDESRGEIFLRFCRINIGRIRVHRWSHSSWLREDFKVLFSGTRCVRVGPPSARVCCDAAPAVCVQSVNAQSLGVRLNISLGTPFLSVLRGVF